MSRVIFPDLKLFKKELTERFLVTLQAIYKNHPAYLYDDDELKTAIYLYPSYADIIAPGKKPRVIIKMGGYDFGLTDYLSNNMASEAKNPAGIVAGYNFNKMMSSSASLMVQAYAEEESSDIADELTLLAVFAARKLFSQMGLVIRGAQVSETDMVDQDQKIYQTVVSIGFDYPWSGQITSNAPPVDTVYPDPPVLDIPGWPGFRTPPGIAIWKAQWQPKE